ncbi:MAG: glucan biosynthesis protein G [Gammaproteobacteria bacterium]|nr:glucan biosynthesis protein G [Gammaproteobacteria bacterium]
MLKVLASLLLAMAVITAQAAETFSFQTVIDKARDLAAQPYHEPEPIPRFMRELSYDQYQDIRFNPDKSLWKQGKSKFQVMLMPPGLFYGHAVKVNIVDGEGAKPLPFKKDLFTFTDPELEKLVPADLGYAGLKLTFPFFQPDIQNQFLVFAGASYFRGVGKDNGWGISTRGIAIDTGLPTGEEFPSFLEFWLVHPAANSDQMMVYGLLDGPSLAGAYQFNIKPGKRTSVDVKAVLYPRNNIKLMGVAPLTSMFYYGENTSRPRGEWRDQVHDSDGLLIHNGNGEWLWRPLINPVYLQMDYLRVDDLFGFGLLQRDTGFNDYHDLGARYEIRPSTWVKPEGKWGPGHVVLVQLPTNMETNDNIVAFWTPESAPTPNLPYHIGYNISFGGAELADQDNGHAINTFVGDGNIIGGGQKKGAYRLIIDFAGASLDKLSPRAAVQGDVTGLDGTEVLEHFVEYNDQNKSWRLSILAKPAAGKSLDLRAFLKESDRALTETWTYRLPPDNDIRIDH